jgi:hypothetical protein
MVVLIGSRRAALRWLHACDRQVNNLKGRNVSNRARTLNGIEQICLTRVPHGACNQIVLSGAPRLERPIKPDH